MVLEMLLEEVLQSGHNAWETQLALETELGILLEVGPPEQATWEELLAADECAAYFPFSPP